MLSLTRLLLLLSFSKLKLANRIHPLKISQFVLTCPVDNNKLCKHPSILTIIYTLLYANVEIRNILTVICLCLGLVAL